jgi:tagatose-1,6-bisphosphate aldolase non-catalytic subunit AgaZ/GatZ
VNPIRTGRTILFALPYFLIITGILVAGAKVSTPGGGTDALQALAVAAVGALWACVRARR